MLKDTTINKEEVKKFSALAEQWWDESGKFKPLHDINPVRIKFIKDNIIKHFKINARTLENLKLLDIGCGGGLLSVPMTRLGAFVTGIDPSEKNIKIAKQYVDENRLKIDFKCCGVQDLIRSQHEKFDVILNMEVVEHVDNIEIFLLESSRLLKKNGLVFISTINKTIKSLLQAKFIAEYILRWLPVGTHEWKKFIKPEELINIMSKAQLEVLDITGIKYNMISKTWYLSDNVDVNYMICFKMTDKFIKKK
ncbi:bifunctional 2-polyprenyl-6-hydroxyphenol methylase/3-demethylubiquinol 3-O-methyltransferase UbiG [Candidatus Bandiella numerosa]|uniref:bifunctional 2-polyprenyl-6-hydroxyphenol methylase/3-demethylubiquinol 3-O-methyltransferase UbiG n=1 Tax=Candidatus Bandiella numerosa TaxID=2570586 RepID=UPI00249EA26A|nr:bifunctional 2-polyprenyl-6-hydroxyphenol methylase/3-demethylubiquinol 3-O-methyltransferase UbiG [Candidatus Bandiella numerosa]WHA05224.1 bifunctional 2-polyprenyl-6-hydroxyphenol methylase/3-demethylubiquinol 3-O-methyltransferase UbiG [Candidatus Bandiella numerosa]